MGSNRVRGGASRPEHSGASMAGSLGAMALHDVSIPIHPGMVDLPATTRASRSSWPARSRPAMRREHQQADDGRPHRHPRRRPAALLRRRRRGRLAAARRDARAARSWSSSPTSGWGRSTQAALAGAEIPEGTERLLLKTPNSELWAQDEFTHDFARLDGSGAGYVLERGIRLIGIDYLSIGDADAHHDAARRRRRRARGARPAGDRARPLRAALPADTAARHRRSAGAGRAARPRRGAGMSGVARGGIDLGGTKIQAIVVDSGNDVLGEARRPTPQEGGPARRRRGDGRVHAGGGRRGGVRERRAERGRGRLSRRDRVEERHRLQRQEPARLVRELPARAAADRGAGNAGRGRQRRQRRHARRGRARRRPPPRLDARRLLGHRRRRRARPRRRGLARARRRPARSATWSSSAAASAARAGTGAAWRPTPGARRWRREARRRVKKGRQDATSSS